MKKIIRNQLLKPRVNKIGPTQKEPRKVRMYLKSGETFVLFAKLDHVAAIVLEHKILKFLRENNSKLEGQFIQTQQ